MVTEGYFYSKDVVHKLSFSRFSTEQVFFFFVYLSFSDLHQLANINKDKGCKQKIQHPISWHTNDNTEGAAGMSAKYKKICVVFYTGQQSFCLFRTWTVSSWQNHA